METNREERHPNTRDGPAGPRTTFEWGDIMYRTRAPAYALAALLLLAMPALADWDDGQPAKWVQWPDLTPMGIDVNCSNHLDDYILADDFECTEPGLITGIHIWGSWLQDELPLDGNPEALTFTLSLHADIPADQNPLGYSMPGELLWMRTFQPGEFSARVWEAGLMEGWMNPPEDYMFPGDTVCWQYNFFISPEEAFEQVGTPDEPVVYWLDVEATLPHDQIAFGWKTSMDHWNDDAVWGVGPEPYMGPWYELVYPPMHELAGQSIDLAFVIQSEPLQEELDYGDAPDAVGALSYPTLLINNGARHVLDSTVYMGTGLDAEPDGLPSGLADGDDNNGIDDEDGVNLHLPWQLGQAVTFDVTVSTNGYIDAWVDWNLDGDWADANEQVVTAYNTGGGGTYYFGTSIPYSAPVGQTYMRVRFNTMGGLPYDGPAPDGEVEDYFVEIEPEPFDWKWEQPPDLTPMGIDINGSPLPGDYILADDFLCTERGRITVVRVWGSWLGDYLPFEEFPDQVKFTLSFHGDIPADQNPDGYSMPDDVLWMRDFHPGEYTAEIWQDQIVEGWMDPPEDYVFPGDTVCWVYEFFIPEEEAFLQLGDEANPVVYWLDVKAEPFDPQALWGWKTSEIHWNDDAVFGHGAEPYAGPWYELIYPPNHELHGQSIDLAFALEGVPEPAELDFGDAPDGAAAPGYPTYLANAGANHVIVPGFFLGNSVDAEPDGQPDAAATGDDTDGNDDEDGVTFVSPLRPGCVAYVDVTASAAGMLDAWIDYGTDQSWAEFGDQIFAAQPLNPGLNHLSFVVPAGTAQGITTFARFRLSSVGGLPSTGPAHDGEVEDHMVTIEERYTLKWLQNPDLSPMGIDVAACVSPPGDDYLLADDFLCTTTGPITDIRIWGSWLNDYLPFGQDPRAMRFILSIHADIPAGVVEEWSMPGDVLWFREFGPGEFQVEPYAEQIVEGFMYPPDMYLFPADWTCWLYEFHVDPHLAFKQEGTEDEPIVYWLDLKAFPDDPEAQFGWKTSVDHWNDDAVWGLGMEPYFGPWWELRYPPGHELFGQSIDLAFAILEDPVTGVPEGPVPDKFGLRQNVPNPFNPRTEIRYDVPAGGGHVRLEIYDAMGRRVRTLVDGHVPEGERTAVWDGQNDRGQALSTGVYFARLYAEGVHRSVKMVLLR